MTQKAMKPLKFPLHSTLALFAIAGLLTFVMPLPQFADSSSVISKMFR